MSRIAGRFLYRRDFLKTAALVAPVAASLNVRGLGAVGDGKTNDTLALQQAIDRCAFFSSVYDGKMLRN